MGPLSEFYVANSALPNHYHPSYHMIHICTAYIYHMLWLRDRLSGRLLWFNMSGFLFLLFGFIHQSAYIFLTATGIFCCCPLLSLCKVLYWFVYFYNLDLWSTLLYTCPSRLNIFGLFFKIICHSFYIICLILTRILLTIKYQFSTI